MSVSDRSIPWRRLLAESVAVVLSILLAFGIDAWWDGKQQSRREADLLAGLLSDFEASRPGLVSRVELARRMTDGNSKFLDMTDAASGRGTLEVPDSLVLAVLGGPTYEPEVNTLDAALASGEIGIVGSAELRAELADWRRILSDTREDELEVRRITNEQLTPLLARGTNLHPYFEALLAWSGGDPYSSGRLIGDRSAALAGSARVVVSTELVAALSLREFFVRFAAADLEELLGSTDRVLALLEREAGR